MGLVVQRGGPTEHEGRATVLFQFEVSAVDALPAIGTRSEGIGCVRAGAYLCVRKNCRRVSKGERPAARYYVQHATRWRCDVVVTPATESDVSLARRACYGQLVHGSRARDGQCARRREVFRRPVHRREVCVGGIEDRVVMVGACRRVLAVREVDVRGTEKEVRGHLISRSAVERRTRRIEAEHRISALRENELPVGHLYVPGHRAAGEFQVGGGDGVPVPVVRRGACGDGVLVHPRGGNTRTPRSEYLPACTSSSRSIERSST